MQNVNVAIQYNLKQMFCEKGDTEPVFLGHDRLQYMSHGHSIYVYKLEHVYGVMEHVNGNLYNKRLQSYTQCGGITV